MNQTNFIRRVFVDRICYNIVTPMKTLIQQIKEESEKNRANLIQLIQDTVRIPSYPGETEKIQLFLQEKMAGLGMETRIIKIEPEKLKKYKGFSYDGFSYDRRYCLTGIKKGKGNSGKSLILNGHVDVVPPGDLTSWHGDPLSGKLEQGKIYGRGSLDMKAGLCAAITAIKVLHDIGFKNNGDIIVSSVCGEETGGCGAFAVVEDGLTADGCIILEPTKLNICHIQSGCHTFKIKIKGSSIHACMAYKGVNAIDKFLVIYEALKSMDRRRHERFSNIYYEYSYNVAPMSVGIISAGEWPSSVPDLLIAHGRMGIFPGETAEEMHREFEETLRTAASNDPWLTNNMPEIEWYEGLFEPTSTDFNSSLIKTLAESHQKILNREAKFEAATYGSDMRIFNIYAGIPTVLYGPGDVSLAHTANENIEIDQVMETVNSIALMITTWCKGELWDASKESSYCLY